jgi:hypothetical protein
MLSLFLRDLDLTVPRVSKLRQQIKTINARRIAIHTLLLTILITF